MAKQQVTLEITEFEDKYTLYEDAGLHIDDTDADFIYSDRPIDSSSDWIKNEEAASFSDKAGFFSTSVAELVRRYDAVKITKIIK